MIIKECLERQHLPDARCVDIRSTRNKRLGLVFQLEQHKIMVFVFVVVAFLFVLALSTVPWAFQ